MPEGHNFIDYCDTEALVLADPEEFADRAVSENYPARRLPDTQGELRKKIEPSGDLMIQIMQETGDPEMAYAAMVSYAELGGE